MPMLRVILLALLPLAFSAQALVGDDEETRWSLRPLVRPNVPILATPRDGWLRTPIDAFVLAKLQTEGLAPNPEADRRTLIRRLTFDLHGLPPTPEQVEAFVNDNRPDAYERLVDTLLASPRYGERWGRHWLDVVHYGDTHGYDKDKRRDNAWPYRDYVIKSFNDDKPYARFIEEQLAGDVLWPNDPEAVKATGFVVAGPWDFVGHVELREGTVEKDKTRSLDRDDMLANAMATFTSMTVHCARCHDHKFDPITQQDYYRLQAVFAGVERGDRAYASLEVDAQRKQATQERQALTTRQATLEKHAAKLANPELTQLAAETNAAEQALAKLPPFVLPQPSPTNGFHSAIMPTADHVKWVQVDLGESRAIDHVILYPARPTDFPDSPGFGFPLRLRVEASDDPEFIRCVSLLDKTAEDVANPGDVPLVIAAPGQRGRYVRVTATRLWPRTKDFVFALGELQVVADGRNFAAGAPVQALDSIEAGRWSTKHLVDGHTSRNKLPDQPNASDLAAFAALTSQLHSLKKRDRELRDQLLSKEQIVERKEIADKLADLDNRLKHLPKAPQVYGVMPVTPRPIHVLRRGDVKQPRELASPGALELLPKLPSTFAIADANREGERRVALARWLISRDNVLTWRSVVNRIWHYHFGKGIVETPNDFGKNGSLPSHPELLDWLAVEFRDKGGSLKQLHRLIVTSSVYRQSSAHHPDHAKKDGENRYLWRFNRQRLDAESIRDAVLATSGELDLAMGGPGYDLFRFRDDHSPEYDHAALEKINDPTTYRRTVYRFVVRSVPNPFLDCLDCADPNLNVPVRNRTLTALQSLALLNDPFMIRQAERMAARVQKQSPDLVGQIAVAYRLALGRQPTAEEAELLSAHAAQHGLPAACRLLFNANEFVFVD